MSWIILWRQEGVNVLWNKWFEQWVWSLSHNWLIFHYHMTLKWIRFLWCQNLKSVAFFILKQRKDMKLCYWSFIGWIAVFTLQWQLIRFDQNLIIVKEIQCQLGHLKLQCDNRTIAVATQWQHLCKLTVYLSVHWAFADFYEHISRFIFHGVLEMVYSTEIYTDNGIEYTAGNTYERTEYPLVNRTKEDVPIDILSIFGPTNPYFDLIHYTVLVCLAVSIIISLYTVIYLLTSEKGNVFNWKIGKWIFLPFSQQLIQLFRN